MSVLRTNVVVVLILLLAAAVGGRLFSVQISQRGFWTALAKGQQQFYEEVKPERGKIFFQDKGGRLIPAAMNKNFPMLYAKPKELENPEETAEFLARVFAEDQGQPDAKEESDHAMTEGASRTVREELKAFFLPKLGKEDDPHEVLWHRLSEAEAGRIREAGIAGLYLGSERLRAYPQNDLASHVIGFVGYLANGERVGVYGIEGAFEDFLAGMTGFLTGEKDVRGSLIAFLGKFSDKPKAGSDIVLTIDANIQAFAEDSLRKAYDAFEAEGGSVVVMNPKNGDILAMAALPDFDPNQYEKAKDQSFFLNPVVSHLFEPGSVLKPITLAAAIDAGAVGPRTTFENTNEVQIGSYTIRNVVEEKTGLVTMIEVLEDSLNTGAVFAEQSLGHEHFVDYMKRFGFAEKTGIDLPGEVSNNIRNLYEKKEINFATASFGQGIAMTPISLLRGLAAIANNGNLAEPRIVAEMKDAQEHVSDSEQKQASPRAAISAKTATQVTAMMVSAVKNGTGKRAQIPGYTVAGKTGTAQVPSLDTKGYDPHKTIHSFVGFAPAFNPQFIILVKLDYPKGVRYAEGSVVPVFREIAEYIINYYGIPPDNPTQ